MDEVRGWWVLVHFWPMTQGLDHPVTYDPEDRLPPAVAGQGLDLSAMISWRPFQNPSACSGQELLVPARVAFSCRKSAARLLSFFFFGGGLCFCELTDRGEGCKWRH
jgi:hypothetical protein